MEITFETQELKELATKLVELGYEVYLPAPSSSYNKCCYFHYGNETGVAYVQQERFRLAKISTVHKPNKNVGTGYGLEELEGISTETDPKLFQWAIELRAPHWDIRNAVNVVKYKNIEEWSSKEWMKKVKYQDAIIA